MKNWATVPLKFKVFFTFIVLTAVPLLSWAIRDVIIGRPDYLWLVLTAITLITVPIFVFLPSVRSLVTIGDAFVISICMLWGTSAAIVANTLYISYLTLLLRRKHKTAAYRIIINIAIAVLNVGIYGFVYHLLNPTSSYALEDILLPTFALAMTFFMSNSLLIATAIALASNGNIFQIWKTSYPHLSLDFLVSACAGAFIVFFRQYGAAAPLLVAPFVGAVWGINKINRSKAMEAKRHLLEQEQLYMRTVESLALAVDAKDQTTYGHIRRVRAYAMGLAKLCNITDSKELMAIETGSLLHDIGKLAVEDYILNKPGKLSKKEFEKMKMHSAAGDEILQQIQFPFPVSKYVRCHHERWDGKGYPDGLKADEIPLGARILSIADAFDAIRSSRPYKSAFGIQDSVELLKAQSGSIYDPRLVNLFTNHVDELSAAADKAAQNAPELSFRKYFAKVDSDFSDDSLEPSQSPTDNAYTELVRIFEFCCSLAKQLDFNDILHIISGRIKQLVPYTTCAIYLYNANDALKAEYVCGEHSDYLQNATIGLGKGISGWVAAYKRPMLNTTPSWEFQEIKGDFSDLTDILAVPLLSDSDCIGTVTLYAKSAIKYSQSQLNLLQAAVRLISPLLAEVLNQRESASNHDLIDPVTRTYRISHLAVSGSQLLDLAKKQGSPLSLICLDIRNYRQLANLYGIGVGDSILRQVSSVLQSELREMDVLVRFGQHGFVVLLPGVRKEQATRYAHRLQQQLRNMPTLDPATHPVNINCQLGVASYPGDGTTIFVLLQQAQISISEHAKLANSHQNDSDDNIVEFPPRIY